MNFLVKPARLHGHVDIPGSKSHTIRAVACAALAEGSSMIHAPLASADTLAAVETYRALGAKIITGELGWEVRGTGGRFTAPADIIDVKNSGTTLRIAIGSASLLQSGCAAFTGDESIRQRPLKPLLDALTELGASIATHKHNGCAPLTVHGTLMGGHCSIQAVTSQYLTSLLMAAPLAGHDTVIDVPLLNEAPYIHVTLDWLKRCGIEVDYEDDFSQFRIPAKQNYQPIDVRVPADFSSATFFLCAGAIGENDITCRGLDLADTQGDKAVIDYLAHMGAQVDKCDYGIRVRRGDLRGCEIDLNATPDALPMLAVLGCFAEGRTALVNCPQARMKETDRIAVMAEELGKLGAKTEQLDDGLIVHQSDLRPAEVCGHHDHRVVMALAIAASAMKGHTIITTAESVEVTFPRFVDSMADLGGYVDLI